MVTMKSKMLLALVGALTLVAGCVKTVSDTNKAVVSPTLMAFKDKYESRYERSVDQVYSASLDALKANGTISRESILDPGTNLVRAIEAKIDKRYVFVRVEPVDPKVTSVKVQARTTLGGTDQDLTAELQKQIGIRLATQ
jgi:outer membrane murein-binding lipoprotein Lpp